MTAPLRRNHFLTWVFLPVLLALLLAVSLWSRRFTTPDNPQADWEDMP